MAEDKKNVLQKLKDGLDDKEEQLFPGRPVSSLPK